VRQDIVQSSLVLSLSVYIMNVTERCCEKGGTNFNDGMVKRPPVAASSLAARCFNKIRSLLFCSIENYELFIRTSRGFLIWVVV
jgi:hypothetical protein